VHVYVLPFVNPDTTTGLEEPLPDPETPPSLDVHPAVNPDTELPPSLPGANATATDAFPAAAVPIVGAPGETGSVIVTSPFPAR
jgi:hypothetical protein